MIRYLESLGYPVVEEAATAVIGLAQAYGESAPWTEIEFIEKVLRLQIQRRANRIETDSLYQFFDRSPLCTLALANYLNYPPLPIVLNEIKLIQHENIYERQVFFIENLGHCQPTEARTISFEEALRFEKIHEAVYLDHGFELIKIPNGGVGERVQLILSTVERL